VLFRSLEAEALTVDPAKPCLEAVKVEFYPKSSGGYRTITKPGWRRRAMQLMLRDTLVAANFNNEFEFACCGKGPFAVADCIRDAIEDGYRHWVIADVKDCFPSLAMGHIKELVPVDQRILRNTAFIPPTCPTIRPDVPDAITNIAATRRGLPQGSVVSPLLASAFLGRVLRGISEDVRKFAYADNIAICAKSYGDLKSAENALVKRLSAQQYGSLQLGYIRRHHLQAGTNAFLDFMQFRFGRKTFAGKVVDEVHRWPSVQAFNRRRKKMCRRVRDWPEGTPIQTILRGLREYDHRWMRAAKWPGSQLHRQHRNQVLRVAAFERETLVRDIVMFHLPDEIAGT